jgi:hypothetical protein
VLQKIKSKYKKRSVFVILIFALIIPAIGFSFGNQVSSSDNMFSNGIKKKSLKSSDIAGTDLYAESIGAYVAGDNSLIKHSIFTNDTNILRSFDLADPAFYQCNIFLSASNNINSPIFPLPLTHREIEEQFNNPINSFIGFLYYDPEVSGDIAQERVNRALDIIKNNLEMDLIMVNSSEPNFYPFIGYYPKWNILLEEFTENIPKDGYWQAFDLNRLESTSYTKNKYLSFSFALINTPDFFKNDIDFGNDQLNFNTGATLSPFLKGNIIEDVFNQLTTILEENEDLFDNLGTFLGLNETISIESFENLTTSVGNFSLSKNSHYSIIEVQYEGLESGIQEVEPNQYEFNLFDALGYTQRSLAPSEKVYSAFIGGFLSRLDINILCTDIIDSTPNSVAFSDYFIDQLALLLSFIETDFDIYALQNYSFQLSWRDEGGLKTSYADLINENDEFDIINFLPILGFTGFPTLPSGLANPLNNLNVRYELNNSEANIKLDNLLIGENASFGAYKNFDFNITAETVGNTSAYGIPTSIPLDIDTVLYLIFIIEGGNDEYIDEFKNTIAQIVSEIYSGDYDNIEAFFNLDKDPRIFQFDINGDGLNDYYFPDPLNISNLYPYNEKMNEVADILFEDYPGLLNNMGWEATARLTAIRIGESFTNIYSIWNDDNWKLKPDNFLTYLYENYSISESDTYTIFHKFDFIINDSLGLPRIIFGEEAEFNSPEMALSHDNESWTIFSEDYFDENRIEIQFAAQNTTFIDLINNTIDRVSLSYNFTENFTNVEFELYNYTSEEYFDLQPYLAVSTNTSSTFSITKYNNSINHLFQNSSQGDYTIIFRIKKEDSNQFNISIDNIDIKFLKRDINPVEIQSNIKYTSKGGKVKYIRHSNSITLSTDNMSSIVSYSSLSSYTSTQGDIISYFLSLKNIGSDLATNITIKIPLPGIMHNFNNFSLRNNHLYYYLDALYPGNEKHLNFSFYVPNSELLENHIIKYNNSEFLEKENSTILSSQPNNLFSVSPINYKDTIPYIHIIDIFLNPSENRPSISEIFNISLNIKYIGPQGLSIDKINISSRDKYGDLIRTSNENLIFNNITYNQIKAINFSINKTDWKGYLYPAINLLNNKDSKIFQIRQSEPLVLGSIIISVKKSVNKNELERGGLIIVNVKIKNIGTITAKNLELDDIVGYSQDIFALTSGKLIKTVDILNPDESTSITYTLKANSQALTILSSATAEYDFLYKNKAYSNFISIKVITPRLIQNLNILIPSAIVGGIVFIYIWYLRSYKKKLLESERKEIKVLTLTSRDSILTSEMSLKEYLSNFKTQEGGN